MPASRQCPTEVELLDDDAITIVRLQYGVDQANNLYKDNLGQLYNKCFESNNETFLRCYVHQLCSNKSCLAKICVQENQPDKVSFTSNFPHTHPNPTVEAAKMLEWIRREDNKMPDRRRNRASIADIQPPLAESVNDGDKVYTELTSPNCAPGTATTNMCLQNHMYDHSIMPSCSIPTQISEFAQSYNQSLPPVDAFSPEFGGPASYSSMQNIDIPNEVEQNLSGKKRGRSKKDIDVTNIPKWNNGFDPLAMDGNDPQRRHSIDIPPQFGAQIVSQPAPQFLKAVTNSSSVIDDRGYRYHKYGDNRGIKLHYRCASYLISGCNVSIAARIDNKSNVESVARWPHEHPNQTNQLAQHQIWSKDVKEGRIPKCTKTSIKRKSEGGNKTPKSSKKAPKTKKLVEKEKTDITRCYASIENLETESNDGGFAELTSQTCALSPLNPGWDLVPTQGLDMTIGDDLMETQHNGVMHEYSAMHDKQSQMISESIAMVIQNACTASSNDDVIVQQSKVKQVSCEKSEVMEGQLTEVKGQSSEEMEKCVEVMSLRIQVSGLTEQIVQQDITPLKHNIVVNGDNHEVKGQNQEVKGQNQEVTGAELEKEKSVEPEHGITKRIEMETIEAMNVCNSVIADFAAQSPDINVELEISTPQSKPNAPKRRGRPPKKAYPAGSKFTKKKMGKHRKNVIQDVSLEIEYDVAESLAGEETNSELPVLDEAPIIEVKAGAPIDDLQCVLANEPETQSTVEPIVAEAENLDNVVQTLLPNGEINAQEQELQTAGVSNANGTEIQLNANEDMQTGPVSGNEFDASLLQQSLNLTPNAVEGSLTLAQKKEELPHTLTRGKGPTQHKIGNVDNFGFHYHEMKGTQKNLAFRCSSTTSLRCYVYLQSLVTNPSIITKVSGWPHKHPNQSTDYDQYKLYLKEHSLQKKAMKVDSSAQPQQTFVTSTPKITANNLCSFDASTSTFDASAINGDHMQTSGVDNIINQEAMSSTMGESEGLMDESMDLRDNLTQCLDVEEKEISTSHVDISQPAEVYETPVFISEDVSIVGERPTFVDNLGYHSHRQLSKSYAAGLRAEKDYYRCSCTRQTLTRCAVIIHTMKHHPNKVVKVSGFPHKHPNPTHEKEAFDKWCAVNLTTAEPNRAKRPYKKKKKNASTSDDESEAERTQMMNCDIRGGTVEQIISQNQITFPGELATNDVNCLDASIIDVLNNSIDADESDVSMNNAPNSITRMVSSEDDVFFTYSNASDNKTKQDYFGSQSPTHFVNRTTIGGARAFIDNVGFAFYLSTNNPTLNGIRKTKLYYRCTGRTTKRRCAVVIHTFRAEPRKILKVSGLPHNHPNPTHDAEGYNKLCPHSNQKAHYKFTHRYNALKSQFRRPIMPSIDIKMKKGPGRPKKIASAEPEHKIEDVPLNNKDQYQTTSDTWDPTWPVSISTENVGKGSITRRTDNLGYRYINHQQHQPRVKVYYRCSAYPTFKCPVYLHATSDKPDRITLATGWPHNHPNPEYEADQYNSLRKQRNAERRGHTKPLGESVASTSSSESEYGTEGEYEYNRIESVVDEMHVHAANLNDSHEHVINMQQQTAQQRVSSPYDGISEYSAVPRTFRKMELEGYRKVLEGFGSSAGNIFNTDRFVLDDMGHLYLYAQNKNKFVCMFRGFTKKNAQTTCLARFTPDKSQVKEVFSFPHAHPSPAFEPEKFKKWRGPLLENMLKDPSQIPTSQIPTSFRKLNENDYNLMRGSCADSGENILEESSDVLLDQLGHIYVNSNQIYVCAVQKFSKDYQSKPCEAVFKVVDDKVAQEDSFRLAHVSPNLTWSNRNLHNTVIEAKLTPANEPEGFPHTHPPSFSVENFGKWRDELLKRGPIALLTPQQLQIKKMKEKLAEKKSELEEIRRNKINHANKRRKTEEGKKMNEKLIKYDEQLRYFMTGTVRGKEIERLILPQLISLTQIDDSLRNMSETRLVYRFGDWRGVVFDSSFFWLSNKILLKFSKCLSMVIASIGDTSNIYSIPFDKLYSYQRIALTSAMPQKTQDRIKRIQERICEAKQLTDFKNFGFNGWIMQKVKLSDGKEGIMFHFDNEDKNYIIINPLVQKGIWVLSEGNIFPFAME